MTIRGLYIFNLVWGEARDTETMQVAETLCFSLALAFLRWELGIWAGR